MLLTQFHILVNLRLDMKVSCFLKERVIFAWIESQE